MNNYIKVSVIVITYNHEQFIKQALDSILMQKVDFKYEILIGDDASTDRTPEILKEYKKLYPDIIDLHLNSVNLGATRNAYNLLMKANGEYIAACEGDDFWVDEYKLQIQVNFLDNNKNYIGCCHPCVIVDEQNKLSKHQKISWISNKKIFTINDFKGYYLPGQVSTILRRNIYKNKEDYSIFYKAHKFIGDRTTILIYLAKGCFFKMDKCISAYRIVEKNKENLTFLIYSGNNKVINELNYTLQLESYANNVLKINAGFRSYKKVLFVDSIIAFMRRPSLRNINTIKTVLNNYKFPLDLLIYFPYGFIQKIYKKIIYEV